MIIDSLANKQSILVKFLNNSISMGWNDANLLKSISDIGLEEKYLPLIFPDRVFGLTRFFFEQNDLLMSEALALKDLSQTKVRDKIKLAIRIYLENNLSNQAALKGLVNFLSPAKNIFFGLKLAYSTADVIWFAIGDKSTDFNFYTKRFILSRVLVRTLNFFVQQHQTCDHLVDRPENLEKVTNFVDHEIEKVMKIQAFKFKLRECLSKTQKISGEFLDMKDGLSMESVAKAIKKLPFIRLFNKDI